jgi:polyferredoxin
MYSKIFRYGFLIFFMSMFGIMVFNTWLVGSGAESLSETIKLFWTFNVPWEWTYSAGIVPDWVAQYSFGFYGLMLTSLLLGLIMMLIFKPRTWCAFCPMGTLSACVTPKADRLPDTIKTVSVGDVCNAKCKVCAKVCPMQLTPYEGKGKETGFFHTDCIKCGTCATACPLKTIKLSTPLKQHNYG